MLDRDEHVSLEQQGIYPNGHSVMGEKGSKSGQKNVRGTPKKKDLFKKGHLSRNFCALRVMAWSCLYRADLSDSREVISGMHVSLEEPRISPNGHSVVGEKGSKSGSKNVRGEINVWAAHVSRPDLRRGRSIHLVFFETPEIAISHVSISRVSVGLETRPAHTFTFF
jgi:hypothetical protein